MKKSKRKYNLPKYICFDVRTTLCRKKPTYDVTLVSNDNKAHSTKTLTVYEAITKVVENRIKYKNWDSNDVAAYINTYDSTMENQYSLADACQAANVTIESVLSGEYLKERYGNKNKKNIDYDIVNISDKENEILNCINTDSEKKLNNEKNRREIYLTYLKTHPMWTMVSNFPEFEIYSEPYLYTNEYGTTCYTYKIRNLMTKKELKPSTKSNSLYVNLNGINKAIYKLAADTFLHNPNKKRDNKLIATEIHHLNGNHHDNRLENLEHVTKEMHAEFHKQLNANKKSHNLKLIEILNVKKSRNDGKSYYKIMEETGLTFAQVKSAAEKTEEQIQRLLKKELKNSNNC